MPYSGGRDIWILPTFNKTQKTICGHKSVSRECRNWNQLIMSPSYKAIEKKNIQTPPGGRYSELLKHK